MKFPNIIGRMRAAIQGWIRRHIDSTFQIGIMDILSVQDLVDKTACPSCNQITLFLASFTYGSRGWEARVTCANCGFSGVLNSTGLKKKMHAYKK